MSDYIRRDEVIDRLNRLCDRVCQYSSEQRNVMCGACPLGDAFTVIEENIPAADVRPVVTCDQCNWCIDLGGNPYCEMLARLCPNGGDWFCAYGEQPRYEGTEADA